MPPSTTNDTMQIACAADARYFRHCAAMLASLLEFNSGFTVHVLCDDDVPDEDRATLSRWAEERGARVICTAPQVDLPRKMPSVPYLTRAAWLRLFLPELLAPMPRVLYLDVDLLVQDSLRELWSTDLEGKSLAAVHDVRVNFARETHESRFGLPAGTFYFNSGVMLLDLDQLRREDIARKCLDYARAHPDIVKWADQDPLNVLLHQKRRPLPLRWNVQAALYENEAAREQPFSEAEMREAMEHPAIVHFSGPWKPWHHRSRHPLRGLYAKYRARTPWPEWQIEGRTLKHRLLRMIPESLARDLTEAYWAIPHWIDARRKARKA